MARTNIVLDEKLMAQCQRLTGIKTKRAVVDHALHELLRIEQQRRLLQLKGKINWTGNLDASRRSRALN